MSKKQHTVIIITGPTASGKTALAIQLAQRFNTEIISADSRQCYKELNIGVAKPSAKELQLVKHHFISSHSIHDNVTAQVFETYALNAVDKIFQKSRVAVMAGGTGLYVKAFCEGLDEMPAIDPIVRSKIQNAYEIKGLSWLQHEVQSQDPLFWSQAEQQNPQRLMRALEVKLATGKSFTDFRRGNKKDRDFNIITLGIQLPKDVLYSYINTRTDQMLKEGLIDEVASLLSWQNVNALQTVGYKEIFAALKNEMPVSGAVEKIKQNTRHYAKRQLTWFRKMDGIIWGNSDELLSWIDENLAFQ
ncbi:tRNA (adenosine(37)-N6)-dimethylallyltransferase MiaA [Panacibacter sp. DH6]|uniref:tRNA dimethylallyltransferase n=1 Tax=Panacibacter microcysteis TaxID=2793269 RepID=A0A931GYI9_9BACT|nr:tRNA (adenosine(37)-N6)-dimethylallyltransferase MiaA [Panacibacter microcysteis]MBG9376242.1 tRNA (adenosine(37)-N6)-dimethylallyltransferase MiaA [Panacibacter microcysteis]